MQIVIFNMRDQSSHPIEIEDGICNHPEDLRLICGGSVYKLTSTVSDEVTKLNKLRVDFETKEFEKLFQKFNFKTKEEVPKDFLDQFIKELEDEERQKQYPEFFNSIKDNKEATYKTLSTHYLTFMFMTNRYNQMVEENAKLRTNPSFFLDFTNRYAKVFKIENYYNKLTLKQISEALDDLHKQMDIDDRRHAGYDQLLKGVSSIGTAIPKLLSKDVDNTPLINTVIDFGNEKFGSKFKEFDVVFRMVSDYYEKLPERVKSNTKAIRKLNEDPVKAYLTGLKNTVARFLMSTDKYLKDASRIENDDQNQLKIVRDAYIEEIKVYYETLDYIYGAFDADDVKFEEPIKKQFDALWESSMYYKSSQEGDWFLTLARLLYKSFREIFASVLEPGDLPDETEEEKTETKTAKLEQTNP